MQDVPKSAPQTHHVINLHVRGARLWRSDPTPEPGSVTAGTVSIMPGGLASRWSSDGVVELLQLYLPDAFVQQVAQTAFDTAGEAIAILERTGVDDPGLRQLALGVAQDLLTGLPPLASELDAWGQLVALKLLRHHSSLSSLPEPVRKDQLTPNRLRKLTEYIDAHFADNPSLDALAEVVGLSASHFSRAVKSTTGLSPHRLVMRRRIQEAKHLLSSTTLPLAQVGSMVGYTSQSHLTSAFRKETGTTPGRYRRIMDDDDALDPTDDLPPA